MIDFCDFIRFVLAKYDYTYGQFSIICGVHKLTVYRWYNKLIYPDYKSICHIIHAYREDFIDWLHNIYD